MSEPASVTLYGLKIRQDRQSSPARGEPLPEVDVWVEARIGDGTHTFTLTTDPVRITTKQPFGVEDAVYAAQVEALGTLRAMLPALGIDTAEFGVALLDRMMGGPTPDREGLARAAGPEAAEWFTEDDLDRICGWGGAALFAMVARIRPEALTPERIAVFMQGAGDGDRQKAMAALAEVRRGPAGR